MGFYVILANGDIIVTLLPVNTQWPWITPAKFRPELVPEELMAQGLTVSEIHECNFHIQKNSVSVNSRRLRSCHGNPRQ